MKKNELKTAAFSLYNQGMSYGKIAEQLGISKTTAYSWILNGDTQDKNVMNVPKTKKGVPNEIQNEQNEFEDIKKELKEDYGTDKDISALVDLRKAEMEHSLKMENLELEREKLLNTKEIEKNSEKEELLLSKLNEINSKLESEAQKSEQLQAALEKIKNENIELHKLFQKKDSHTEKIQLDASLKDDCSDNIREYLALEDNNIILQDVETVFENNEAIIKTITKWCKVNKQKKSHFPELSALKEIKKSLIEMTKDFDEDEDIELVFDFNPNFREELTDLL
jgi:transposase